LKGDAENLNTQIKNAQNQSNDLEKQIKSEEIKLNTLSSQSNNSSEKEEEKKFKKEI